MIRLGLPLTLVVLLVAGCGSSRSLSAATPQRPSGALTTATRIAARGAPSPAEPKVKPKPTAKPKTKAKAHTTKTTAKSTRSTANTPPATTPSTSSPTSTPAPATPPPGATLDANTSLLGTILVDASGRALYLFKNDSGTSTCYGSCAVVWPPFTTNGSPAAGAGVQSSLLGTTARSDGKTQVTYAGHPLYYFAGDSTAGAANGQGIKQFGARWWVVSPAGHAIKHL